MRVAIIGAGVSGLSTAHFLKNRYEIKVFEKDSSPGGLIKCCRVEENLFHICGGHVFNSKRQDVLDWFWKFFDQEEEFSKADRNSAVYMNDDLLVPYPIENHMYMFDKDTQSKFIDDILRLSANSVVPINFEDFLRKQFGDTLYKLYFKPYNEKVWRRDLNKVPLSWLEGKLPIPTVQEMIYNNMNHVKDKAFVHATFWYEKNNGSQYLADKLAEGLDIQYNSEIKDISLRNGKWTVCGEEFDKTVFCGNIKDLPTMLRGVDISGYLDKIDNLEYHGTTAVFCEIKRNPYTWIYLPSPDYECHRIICTGNFSLSNNAEGKMTATIEFTDYISEEDIKENLKKVPYVKKYLTHKYNQYTYPIQDIETRPFIKSLKSELSQSGFYLSGRFADWEYYNMDAAMGAAMDLCKII